MTFISASTTITDRPKTPPVKSSSSLWSTLAVFPNSGYAFFLIYNATLQPRPIHDLLHSNLRLGSCWGHALSD